MDKRLPDSADRRRFLKLSGAGLLGVLGSAGTVVGQQSHGTSTEDLTTTGLHVFRYIPHDDDDYFLKEERFVSQELKDRYGKATVVFEPEPFPREFVPDEHKNTDEEYVQQYRDTAVIGTSEELYDAEQQESETTDGDITTDSVVRYTGPKYVHKSGDLNIRTGPINVGWRRYLDLWAGDVKRIMRNNGWRANEYYGKRYILTRNGPKAQNREVGRNISFPRRWHIRIYNIPGTKYKVIGQAHHDPYNHYENDRRFSRARNVVLNTWRNRTRYRTGRTYVGNRSGFPDRGSYDGYMGVIH